MPVTYEVTTFDVCQEGFERLRSQDEFILRAHLSRSSSKAGLKRELFADIQAVERETDFDYEACRKAVSDYVNTRVDMQTALRFVERGGCPVFMYLRQVGEE